MHMRGSAISMNAERSSVGRRAGRGSDPETPKKKPNLKKVLPEIWKLVRPRRCLLLFGFFLMIINRVSGLVLPGSTKYFIDNILRQGNATKLPLLVGIVFTATAIQGITSFSLTQLLSKAGQRLITELRKQVQQHIGRLSVSLLRRQPHRHAGRPHHDRRRRRPQPHRHRRGRLRRRHPHRHLRLRASSSRSSRMMTLIVFVILLVFVFILQRAFKTIRPIFRERAKINAEVTGRLTESLGGVRVVKGYHAEQREASVFAAGVQRLLDNVMRSLTATSRSCRSPPPPSWASSARW